MTNKINMVINLSILALLIYLAVSVKELQDKVFPDPNIMIPLIQYFEDFFITTLFMYMTANTNITNKIRLIPKPVPPTCHASRIGGYETITAARPPIAKKPITPKLITPA